MRRGDVHAAYRRQNRWTELLPPRITLRIRATLPLSTLITVQPLPLPPLVLLLPPTDSAGNHLLAFLLLPRLLLLVLPLQAFFKRRRWVACALLSLLLLHELRAGERWKRPWP